MFNQKNATKFIMALFLVGSSVSVWAETVPNTLSDHGTIESVKVEAPEAIEAQESVEVQEIAEAPEAPEIEAMEAPEAAEAPETH